MTASITQLSSLRRLSEEDRRALLDRLSPSQRYPAGRDLFQANEPSPGLCMIRAGIACRYVRLRRGERQILGLVLPGDLVDVRACYADHSDFSAGGLTSIELATLPRRDFLELMSSRPGLTREMWRLTAVEDATARQWLLNVGHRTALERVAHLLCECYARLSAAALTVDNSYLLPITQRDLADALALSAVHVNRTLMSLRRDGLIQTSGHRVTIPDLKALQDAAGFNPRYLQTGPLAARLEPTPPVLRSPLAAHSSGILGGAEWRSQ